MSEIAIPEKLELAKTLAVSNLLPAQYRNQPGNLLYAIEYAEAIGVHRMTAITGIHVIEGKPSASAQLIAALVRRAGHKLRVSYTGGVARAVIIRTDDPDFEFVSEWSMKRASDAGLTGKKVWKQYPDAMLKARAITEVARDAASEALFGIIYTAEELGATEVDRDGAYIGEVKVERAPAPTADPFVKPARDWAGVADDLVDVEALRALYQEARAGGADADALAHIAARGKTLADAAAQAEAAHQADAEVVDAEVVDEDDPFAPQGADMDADEAAAEADGGEWSL